ncbi:hypothetical protein Sjap_017553 [Stephania japonica]|uniref:NAC domain-containing protein n=1 Tax=Stephania japonica TaxID=461633 RepID=A0AAP0NJK7_9MAGN
MALCSVLGGSGSSDVLFRRGYVFAPTDLELLHHFLLPKTQNPGIQFEEIHDLADSIINYLPDILTSLYERKRAKEWYFFSPRIKKHKNSSRSNRCIVDRVDLGELLLGQQDVVGYNGQFLGNKAVLNFFEAKNLKTDWIMQEYILAPQYHSHGKFEDYALCKIYKKSNKANTSTKTNTTSTVLVDHHQFEEENKFDVGAQEGAVNCINVPYLPSYSCGDVNGVGHEEAALVPPMNNITAHEQYINVDQYYVQGGTMNEAAMVLPALPYYSCGDVDGDQQSITVPAGAAQEVTASMINNLQDQPLLLFMATNSAIIDADMGAVNSGGTTSCFDDHENIEIDSLLLDIDCDIDNEEFMTIMEAAYNNPDTAPNAGAEVETIEVTDADQPSSSSPSVTAAAISMDTDIMRDEQNDIFAELQPLSPLKNTCHFT